MSNKSYCIMEVDAFDYADTIHNFNRMAPNVFTEELNTKHVYGGYWWLVFYGGEAVAFAGMVDLYPFPKVGYLKRCYVMPEHRGHGLQLDLIKAREEVARRIGWTLLVTDCLRTNDASLATFARAGYTPFVPERPWAKEPSLYYMKEM